MVNILLFQIIGVDFVYFIQRNVLDRRNNVLEIEAYNESFATRVTVIEKCRYFVSIRYRFIRVYTHIYFIKLLFYMLEVLYCIFSNFI